MLHQAARNYVHARRRPVGGSAFARHFRRDMAQMLRDAVAHRPERLMVRASVGAPGWAAVPWLACFAPHVTRSMRHGLYVAILIDAPAEAVILSLQHGAAEALTRHGPIAGPAMLRAMAEETRARLDRPAPPPLTLAAAGDLARGYEAGSALWRSWRGDMGGFGPALQAMLDDYRALVGGAS
ncbi:MrcB family domain-containing protein [Paracoccus aestuarii]|uniref:MrcB family domain-containing protein n=1 Tax=Paracoccus aestuarii TaxID=453842 RepID=UPI0014729ECE|nr:DUF3578 domain-containing protein [Paracoccus aestuarii]WCR00106.1 DUF3578 domain-containing protein [Paracoccus aestuarii]